ncbi:hypothetical protein KLL85_02085 [Clostridioides difficile]|nr:hypothetical protein [Clostridioides difficile]EKS6831174.1 hypothetical protein [Clostridioides difficile]MBY2252631.1 hypothetical protein [Clostridioides difficile]MDN9660791.1 hypothetical protein [Clostridioides difficile]HBE9955672.1 hypothetical protein [Clostridioides difficile]
MWEGTMNLANLIPFIISAAALSPINSNDKVLRENQLKDIFPDANLRAVVKRYINPDEMTISNIKALDGEFYATGESISNLKGISYLENVDNFIFWNNNIKEVPKEALSLKDMDSINLANNYLIDDDVVNSLSHNGVDVNCDLNFIDTKDNQYKLDSKYHNVDIAKGESIDLRKIITKKIDSYYKYWEVTDNLPKDLNFIVSVSDKSVLSCEDMIIKGNKTGQAVVKVILSDKNDLNTSQEVLITVNVK